MSCLPPLRAATESAPPVPEEDGGKRTTLPTCPPHRFPPFSILGPPCCLPQLPSLGEGVPQASLSEACPCPGCWEQLGYPLPGHLSVLDLALVLVCDGGGEHIQTSVWRGTHFSSLGLRFHSPQPLAQPKARCLQGASCPPPAPQPLGGPKGKAQEA